MMNRRLAEARDRAARSFARSVTTWVAADGHDGDWARAIVSQALFGRAPSTIAAQNAQIAQAAEPIQAPAASLTAQTDVRRTTRIGRKVLDVGEVALALGVHRNTARAMCERGRFEGSYRLPSGHWRVPRESVDRHAKRAA